MDSIKKSHFILYVSDQMKSAEFYRDVFQTSPTLDVPGMTEFSLGAETVLGLMPSKGIKRLLGDALPDPEQGRGIPRAEIYLLVEDPQEFHFRSLKAGAKELSPLKVQDWGHIAAYSIDQDGHVIAFAKDAT